MAKLIEYNVEGVEESQGGTGVKVKPGVRIARIDLAEARETKKDGSPANDIRLGLNFGSEFDWGFCYVGLGDESDWKLAELIRAVGLKEKGKMDLDKHVKGKFIRVKVNSETYMDEYSPGMGKLMRAQPGDEEGWNAGGGNVSAISSRSSEGPEDDAPASGEKTYSNPEFVPSRENDADGNLDPEVGSYDDWADDDLEAEVGDRELTVPGGRGKKRDKLIAALRAEDEEVSAGGGAEVPDDEAVAEEAADEYDDWDLDQLKTEWEERNLGDLPDIKGRGAADRIKAAIIEELRKDDVENPFTG